MKASNEPFTLKQQPHRFTNRGSSTASLGCWGLATCAPQRHPLLSQCGHHTSVWNSVVKNLRGYYGNYFCQSSIVSCCFPLFLPTRVVYLLQFIFSLIFLCCFTLIQIGCSLLRGRLASSYDERSIFVRHSMSRAQPAPQGLVDVLATPGNHMVLKIPEDTGFPCGKHCEISVWFSFK